MREQRNLLIILVWALGLGVILTGASELIITYYKNLWHMVFIQNVLIGISASSLVALVTVYSSYIEFKRRNFNYILYKLLWLKSETQTCRKLLADYKQLSYRMNRIEKETYEFKKDFVFLEIQNSKNVQNINEIKNSLDIIVKTSKNIWVECDKTVMCYGISSELLDVIEPSINFVFGLMFDTFESKKNAKKLKEDYFIKLIVAEKPQDKEL